MSSKKMKYIQFLDKNHLVNGRCEYREDHIAFSNAGASITFGGSSSEVSVLIEDRSIFKDSVRNWFSVIVNDKYYSNLILRPGKQFYKLDLPPSKNKIWTITLVKSTESMVGEVRCFGFMIPENEGGMDFVSSCTWWGQDCSGIKYIEFIGNSITCGYGNMVSIAPPPTGNPLTGFHPVNENAYESYAMKTARNIRYVPELVSFSGIGMYRNFDGDTNATMPKIYNRIHLQDTASKTWRREHLPSIIVINLGTNDYFGESRNQPLNDSVFVQTYIKFVEGLIKRNPEAKIICANGSMLNDGWPEGKKCWSRIQENLKNVKEHFKTKGNTKIYTFFFTPQSAPYGEDYHPSLATHTKMAEELSTFIQTVVLK